MGDDRMSEGTPLGLRLLRTRAFARAPIPVYRVGLGAVFGSRLLMLEHTGRVSGALRHVVLEVTGRPGPGRYVVVSGFGERAQWLRNVLARPQVRVWTGWHRAMAAEAVRLPVDQAQAVFDRYPVEHPAGWAQLEPIIRSACDLPDTEPLAPHVPVVELRRTR